MVQVIVTDFWWSLFDDFLRRWLNYLDRFLLPAARPVRLSRAWAMTVTTVAFGTSVTARMLAGVASTHPTMNPGTRATSVYQMFTSTTHNPDPCGHWWHNPIIIPILILYLALFIALLGRYSFNSDLSWGYFVNSDIGSKLNGVNLGLVFVCDTAVWVVWGYAAAAASWCVDVYARL